MQLDIDLNKGVLTVGIKGELDISNADRLREALEKSLDEKPARHLVFNFSQVDFIDSSCLGVVLGRYKRVHAAGGKVAIIGAKPHVYRILQLSGLFHLIDDFDSEEEAVKGYVGGEPVCG
ncbi:MAG TPA: anti-sigma F factor antagonist [Clostridia bacterium]|nr:anti-sigma F factor antagonist [Clostridia bacterium]